MKKMGLFLITLLIGYSVFAQEISALLKEFNRRDAIVFTKDEIKVIRFLRSLKYDEKQVTSIELLDDEGANRFLIDVRNGDICIGEISSDLLRCKNQMGLTTIHYVGDSD